ncbi:hypothetical protein ACSBR2_039283 [Camellia fascicularis]
MFFSFSSLLLSFMFIVVVYSIHHVMQAALCFIRIIKEVLDLAENFINPATGLVKEKHHGVLIIGLQLCIDLCTTNAEALEYFRKAGSFVKDEVWHALIVVISNASNLHGYTVRSLYKAVQTSGDQESLV